MKKKLCIILILALLILPLIACQAEVRLTQFVSSYGTHYRVDIFIPDTSMQMLNQSAKTEGAARHTRVRHGIAIEENWQAGDAWTVIDYIRVLAHLSEFDFIPEENNDANGKTKLSFKKIIPHEFLENESIARRYATTSAEQVSRFNPFIRTFRATMPNPFNRFKEHYDGTVLEWSAIRMFRNGWMGRTEMSTRTMSWHEIERRVEEDGWEIGWPNSGEEDVESYEFEGSIYTRHRFHRISLPSFTDAFPIFAENTPFNSSLLNTTFTIRTDARYQVRDGGIRERDRIQDGILFNNRYSFTTRFDGNAENIILYYRRPNPVGWYVLAIGVGGLVVLGIYLYGKKKKKRKIKDDVDAIYKVDVAYGKNELGLGKNDDDKFLLD